MQKKPDYTSSLAMVMSNEVIPDTLLSKLCSENPAALGFIVREQSKMEVEKFPKLLGTPQENFETIKKVMLGRKKFPTMFCFHDYPAEFDEDEIQPFIPLRDSKGNPLLAVGIEGDFPNFMDKSSDGFSEAYMLMYDWLGPKIEAMFKTVGNSPQRLFEYLSSEQFQADFAQVYGHRGVLSFMPSVGNPFVIEKNDIGFNSPQWGSVSNAYGYTEPAIEAATPAKTEPAKVKKEIGASKYLADDPTPPMKPAEVPKVDVPAPAAPIEKVAAAIVEEVTEHKPPTNLHGKSLKQWYRSIDPSGVLPENWRDKPPVRVKVTKHMQKVEEEPKDMKAAKPEVKVTQTGNTKYVDVGGESLPIISGPVQKAATEFIKKHLGDGSAVIDDPLKAQEDEQKLATFTQLMAGAPIKSLDDIDKMRTSFLASFVKQHPETAWLLLLQYRTERKQLKAAVAEGGKKLGELTAGAKTTTPAASESSTVSATDKHVLAAEELKPQKRANASKYA